MTTFTITVFAKDANFDLTPDTLSENFATFTPRFDFENSIPETADLIVETRMSTGDRFWMYRENGKAFSTMCDEPEFLANWPYKREYLDSTILTPDELADFEEDMDILSIVYGVEEAILNVKRYREQNPVKVMPSDFSYNPETDIFIDEVAKTQSGEREHYHMIIRDNVIYLDKTLSIVNMTDYEPITVTTIKFKHAEDIKFSANMAPFFN